MVSSVPKNVLVAQPKALDKKWAQSVLASQIKDGVQAADVKRVEIKAVDVGTTTRVRLLVEHDVEALPKQWFIKLPSLSYRARLITALPRLLPTEVRFYQEISPSVPLKMPKVLSAYSQLARSSTLVLSDVAEMGATPGKVGESLTLAQANRVVTHLAGFHTHFAGSAHDAQYRWLAGPVRQLEDALGTVLAVPLMRRGLRLASDAIPAQLTKPALRYAANRKRIMQYLSTPTPTLTHHDCHPGNLFWQGEEPGFLDWQMVRIGEGISDVSYFLATALEPVLRQKCEMDLLKAYHEAVETRLGQVMEFEKLLVRYRAHLAYAFEAMIITLAVGGMMQLDANLEMIRRSAQVVADHDTFGLLEKACF